MQAATFIAPSTGAFKASSSDSLTWRICSLAALLGPATAIKEALTCQRTSSLVAATCSVEKDTAKGCVWGIVGRPEGLDVVGCGAGRLVVGRDECEWPPA